MTEREENQGELRAADLAVPREPDTDVIPVLQAAFFTDSNRLMKEIQNRTFAELTLGLFDTCRERYLAACSLVGVEPELARLAREVQAVERPALERVFRKVAAFYRFAFVGDQQVELPFGDRDQQIQLGSDWMKFFRLETQRLARVDRFARSVLRAVALSPAAESQAAEAHAVDMLGERYGPFYLQRRLELLKLTIQPEELEGWRFLEGPDWSEIELDPRVRPDPPA